MRNALTTRRHDRTTAEAFYARPVRKGKQHASCDRTETKIWDGKTRRGDASRRSPTLFAEEEFRPSGFRRGREFPNRVALATSRARHTLESRSIRDSRRRSLATSVRGETLYRFHSRGLPLSRSLSLAPAGARGGGVSRIRAEGPAARPGRDPGCRPCARIRAACAVARRRPAHIWSRTRLRRPFPRNSPSHASLRRRASARRLITFLSASRDAARHSPYVVRPYRRRDPRKNPRALHYTTACTNGISTQNGRRAYLRPICQRNGARCNAVPYWPPLGTRSVVLGPGGANRRAR